MKIIKFGIDYRIFEFCNLYAPKSIINNSVVTNNVYTNVQCHIQDNLRNKIEYTLENLEDTWKSL